MASLHKLHLPLTLALISMACGQALAEQATTPPPDLGGSILQMVFGLGIVLVMLFISLWLLKRLSAPRGEAAGLLRIVAGTAVGPRERVVILEVAGTWMVLGVAPGQVNALAEIPKIAPPAQTSPPAASALPAWLQRLLESRRAR